MQLGKNRMGDDRLVQGGRDRASKHVRESAGRLPGDAPFERLEPRVLLSVDHPSLMFPLFPSDGTALDVSGDFEDAMAGRINAAGDDDLFRFVMPGGPGQSDFVSILADTTSTGADLDTRVEIYDTAGRLIAGPSIDGRTGLDNGELSTGIASDGWAGFVATARQTYFVRVLGENDSVGAYQLRIQTSSTHVQVQDVPRDPMSMTLLADPQLGEGRIDGVLGDVNGQGGFAQDDMIFRLGVDSTGIDPELLSRFDSVGSVNALDRIDPDTGLRVDPIDTHIEIYDAAGNLLASDIEAGRLTDAFLTFKSRLDTTFFIRVRSDELVQPPRGGDQDDPTRGEFTLVVNQASRVIEVDMRTRLGSADVTEILLDGTSSDLFQFTSQGTGRAFIDTVGTFAAPPNAFPQPGIQSHLFDSDGNELAFSPFGNLDANLIGGETYFILVEGFSSDAGLLTTGQGGYAIFIESHHTVENFTDDSDDHVDRPEELAEDNTEIVSPEIRRRLELATPLIFDFDNPFPTTDADGNILADRGLRIAASGTGRLFGGDITNQFTDSDLFQFVAPADQLGEYDGDNDDAGTGLFVGGNFDLADPNGNYPTDSRNFAVWDANDFWAVGAQSRDPFFPVGFTDNPDTADTDGAFILSMLALEAEALGPAQQFPELLVGGDFNLVLADGTVIQNLARYNFNPLAGRYVFSPVADPNGPVRAITLFDPEEFTVPVAGDGEDVMFEQPIETAMAVFAGDFTAFGDGTEALRIASIDFAFGFQNIQQVGAGIGTADDDFSVNALAVFDPTDPGEGREDVEGLPNVDDPYDAPPSLFIGGNFRFDVPATPIGAPITTTGIALWNGNTFGPGSLQADINPGNSGGVSGGDATVHALAVFDAPEVNGVDPEPVLVVGGNFTNFNGVAVQNIAAFGRVADPELMDPDADPEANPYNPRLLVEDLAGGTDGTVFALAEWDPADTPAGEDPVVLVVGGDFANVGNNVSEWTGTDWGIAHVFTGVDAPVHTITVVDNDEQEGLIPAVAGVDDAREVLYLGGEFQNTVGLVPFVPPIAVPGIAQIDIRLGTGGYFYQYDSLNSGVGDTAGMNPGTVFAIAAFDDQNPTFDLSETMWDRNDRPSSRVAITLSAGFIRVLDSNGRVVYTNDTIAPPMQDPAGSIDPSLSQGAGDGQMPMPNEAFTFETFGGEVYYIEVTVPPGQLGGGGEYSLSVITDAVPELVFGENLTPEQLEVLQPGQAIGPGSGIYFDRNSTYFESVDAGQFVLGQFSQAALNFAGDFSSFTDTSDSDPAQYNGTIVNRFWDTTPTNNTVAEFNDQANLHSIFDTDLYQFVTPGTPGGPKATVEVRIATEYLDSYLEAEFDGPIDLTGQTETRRESKAKRVRSPLDAAIRIFRSDEEQIQFIDDNPGVGGEFDLTFASAADANIDGEGSGGFQPTFNEFTRRDPRVVFEADPGVNYYIVIESGQLKNVDFTTDPENPDLSEVDWRRVAGGYQLHVNSVLSFIPADDDHVDREGAIGQVNPIFLSTSVPTDLRLGSPTSGSGSASGVISTTVANPVDTDLFNYTSSHTGRLRFSLDVPNGSDFASQITLFDEGDQQIATQVGAAGDSIETTVLAERGGRFFIRVAGLGDSEGAYTLRIEPVDNDGNVISAYVDDHFDDRAFAIATEIDIDRNSGAGLADGSIEEAADSDVFSFIATNYEIATLEVESFTPQLNTSVLVYEVGTDGGRVDTGETSDDHNRVFLRIAEDADPDRRNSSVTFSTTIGLEYFVIVQSVTPDSGTGDYRVSVNLDSADDHPNLAFFPTSTLVTVPFNQSTGIGRGGVGGIIEIPSDDDLFAFVAPDTGDAILELQTNDGLSATLSIVDPITGLVALREDGTDFTSASENGNASLSLNSDQFIGGQTYYFLVDAGTISTEQPNTTGSYSVEITTSPADDHADFGEFGNATPISLDPFTAIGTAAGLISPPAGEESDNDLFTFTALADGRVDILVETNSSELSPALRVLDNTFSEISAAGGDSQAALLSIQAVAGQVYFVVVEANSAQGTAFGTFDLTVDGQSALDDHANIGQFSQATPIVLAERTADASAGGVINFADDTDLFTFTSLSDGPARIQLVTPKGSTLDVSARVFDQNFAQIASDTTGIPGVNAAVEFDAAPGTQYYVLVESANGEVGDYTVRLDTDPPTHFLYYPEGFSSANIDEFIPMVNPNDFDVSYTVVVRYEVGERDQILSTGTLAANSRGGITISSQFDENASAIRKGTPYAIEIQTNGQIGATLSHYDFGVTTGENFTSTLSDTWTFASATRDADSSRDFVVFYNPNAEDINVNFTVIYEDGTMDTFTRAVGAFRRSGINFTTDDAFTKDGKFGLLIEADAPIVSALTSFDIENNRGFGLLGNTGGGAMLGAIPAVTTGDGVESGFSILNTNNTDAEVTITASYARVDLPDIVMTVNIDAMSTETMMLEDLGFFAGEIAGVRYESSMPVTLSAFEFQFGDGDSTPAAVVAGTQFVFGDAFVNPNFAGITYIENLAVYNPADSNANLTLTFLFTDGTTATSNVTVDANDYAYISIDQQPAILNRITPTAFSIQVTSSSPVVASFSHYDLFLNGGWSALGAPIGLTNPLDAF